VSPEAVFIVSLLALAVAVVLVAGVSLNILALPLPTRAAPVETLPAAIPVKVTCPRTTLPTPVMLARKPFPEMGLEVLSCAEFDGAPSCTQSCVSMPVPLVSA